MCRGSFDPCTRSIHAEPSESHRQIPRSQASRPPAPPPPAPKKPRAQKIDPKYLSAARDLRDRYLEEVDRQGLLCGGRYEVGRPKLSATPSPARGLLLGLAA
jgi:hypothetical protein